MLKTRVAVLRGGPSSEYDVSLVTGAGVLKALKNSGYYTKDIMVSKRGEWLVDGQVKSPASALATIDVVFIAMHGAYGEDGTVQKICERLHIPFTGSNSFPSCVAFNKDTTKRVLLNYPVRLPKHVRVKREDDQDLAILAEAVISSFGPEYVLKPLTSGSSHGVVMVNNGDDLKDALTLMFTQHEEFMIEERIRGVEATCAVLENFRNELLYSLPPVEIIPPTTHDFFAADVKYNGATTELCPGRFSFSEKSDLLDAAITVHQALGLSQYSRSDFMVRDGEVYFLEVNTLPGLTPESLFPKAAEAIGLSYQQLIEHLIQTAKVR